MRSIILALAAVTGVSASPPSTQPARLVDPVPDHCPRPAASQAQRDGEPLRMQNLGDLPGANAFAAVWKTENGCTVPVVVQYDIGGPAPRWTAPEPQASPALIRRR